MGSKCSHPCSSTDLTALLGTAGTEKITERLTEKESRANFEKLLMHRLQIFFHENPRWVLQAWLGQAFRQVEAVQINLWWRQKNTKRLEKKQHASDIFLFISYTCPMDCSSSRQGFRNQELGSTPFNKLYKIITHATLAWTYKVICVRFFSANPP